MNKKIYIPALIAVGILALSTSAYAAYEPKSDEVFASFSADEQAAIEEARDIMDEARTEADNVLKDAGLSQDEIREAMKAHMSERREDIQTALEEGDYEAFSILVENTPMADSLTEDVFEKLVEAHDLRDAGKYQEAREIMDELGIKPQKGLGHRPFPPQG